MQIERVHAYLPVNSTGFHYPRNRRFDNAKHKMFCASLTAMRRLEQQVMPRSGDNDCNL
jgi:hypothetical protein